MGMRLNEDELEIYSIAEQKTVDYINDWVENHLYDELYEIIVDYPFKNEFNIPPGSRSVDAAVDRIYYHLKNKFQQ